MTKTILVTGGAGYIGSHAVKMLLELGDTVVVFDSFVRGYHEALETLSSLGNLHIVEGDLRNPEDIERAFVQYPAIEGVFHFAALCLVNESMEQPGLYFANNVIGSLNLFNAMVAHGVKRVIFSSTCAVYGEAQTLPVAETHPTNPLNPYGESKLLTEKMLKWFGELKGLQYCVLRYFNVCGAATDGRIGDSKKPSQLLMQNAVRGALGIEPFYLTCPQVDTPDKTPIRDYIDVEDLVRAHEAAYRYLENGGSSDIFNLGNGKGSSVLEIVTAVEKICDTKIRVTSSPTPRKGEYPSHLCRSPQGGRGLFVCPRKTIEESVLSLKKWYAGHPRGWRR